MIQFPSMLQGRRATWLLQSVMITLKLEIYIFFLYVRISKQPHNQYVAEEESRDEFDAIVCHNDTAPDDQNEMDDETTNVALRRSTRITGQPVRYLMDVQI